ncbi:protein Mpv17 [Contarinia nasturtii]|uniref:protein Mpv17 n=1 Tax=Contarinia nasturtii TaxID=265458 RepID=UPI0012D39296|nr:protein Mpv17 [Contarinia nasturtii]
MIFSKLTRFAWRYNPSIRQFSGKYQKALKKYPILTQAVQAGFLMGAGDFLAQTIIEKQKISQCDYIRTLKFFSIGFCVAGPGLRKWYGALDSYVTAKSRLGRTAQKVFIDQAVFAPIFLAFLLSVIGYSQHQDLGKVKEKLQQDYPDILLANYSVWPWVQILNFSIIPLNYQVLLTQTVAVFWNIYFSWRTNLNERPAVISSGNVVNANTNSNAIAKTE